MLNVQQETGEDTIGSIGEMLRQRRKEQALRLREVAERSGLSVALLSQIERGVSSPSIRSLRAVCSALDMSMGELFIGPSEERRDGEGMVVRRGMRRRIDLGAKGVVKELLTPDKYRDIQMMLIEIRPGGGSGEKPFNNNLGAKAGTVVEGILGLEIDGRQMFLNVGDSFAFDAQRMIRFWCASQAVCRVIWVTSPAVY